MTLVRRMLSVKPLIIIVLVVAVLAGVAVAATGGGGSTSKHSLLITSEVARRTLTDEVTVKGKLGRHEQRKVNALTDGTVTSVHIDDGATVTAGTPMLAIDGRDAVAEEGDLPFFRALDIGSQGEDVKQLKTILRAAGLNPGLPDSLYTEQTRAALAQWQADHGYPGSAIQHDQALTVTLSQGGGYKIGPDGATGVIIKPGAQPVPRTGVHAASVGDPIVHAAGTPVLSVRALDAVAAEGGVANFEIDASEAPVSALDVTLSLWGATASRYVAPVGTITFPANTRSLKVSIPIRQDNLVQPDENLVAQIGTGTGYLNDTTTASILLVSDDVPEITVTGSQTISSGQSALVTLVADQAPTRDTSISLAVGGDATPGRDFRPIAPVVVLPAGQTTLTVTVSTVLEDAISPDKHIVVAVAAGAGGYRVGRVGSAVVTIAGQNGQAAMPTVTLRGNATHLTKGQPLTLTINLDHPTSVELPVLLAYSGTAAVGTDYLPAGRVVVPAGQSSITVPITTVLNGLVEPDHTLTVALSESSLYTVGDPSAVTTLVESTDLPKLTLIGGGDVASGGSTSFVIEADQPPAMDTSVNYQIVGTATPGKDFEAVTGTAILKAGTLSVSVSIRTIPSIVFKPTDMIVGHWPIRVGQVLVKQGQLVPATTPLMSLTDTGLTVTLHASATDRTKLKIGQKVTATLSGGVDEAEGEITKLDDTAQVDPTTKEQYYEGTVAVSDLKGADGAEVSLKVVADQRGDVLTVPIAAVKQNGAGRDVVRVIDLANKGKVREVPVTTGLSEDSYIEIRKGLTGGEVVVVEVDKKS